MVHPASPFEALSAAVLRSGSQSAFARICGVSQTAVWKWLQSGKRLPAEHVLTVERETGISKHLLRPDLYPSSGADCPSDVDLGAAPVVCNRRALSIHGRPA
ncbi:transcriptional regulator [Sphingomonas panni]|uniref:transcriptional regulator n=1 Tax=Sphingomonas panni TaxID=237612 RepID=UPI001F5B1EF4|nr:YdaS family helix-turn-helix protein [Sphingomonas panni]